MKTVLIIIGLAVSLAGCTLGDFMYQRGCNGAEWLNCNTSQPAKPPKR